MKSSVFSLCFSSETADAFHGVTSPSYHVQLSRLLSRSPLYLSFHGSFYTISVVVVVVVDDDASATIFYISKVLLCNENILTCVQTTDEYRYIAMSTARNRTEN